VEYINEFVELNNIGIFVIEYDSKIGYQGKELLLDVTLFYKVDEAATEFV
jgi:hypothetical protein